MSPDKRGRGPREISDASGLLDITNISSAHASTVVKIDSSAADVSLSLCDPVGRRSSSGGSGKSGSS